MSPFKKGRDVAHSSFLLIFILLIGLICFSVNLHAEGDTTARKDRPQPPPHPKPPSIKKILDIFKKHKKDSLASGDKNAGTDENKDKPNPTPPPPPPPAPNPQPAPVKPKATTTHASTKKKTKKTTKPATDQKKPADKKPIQPLM